MNLNIEPSAQYNNNTKYQTPKYVEYPFCEKHSFSKSLSMENQLSITIPFYDNLYMA